MQRIYSFLHVRWNLQGQIPFCHHLKINAVMLFRFCELTQFPKNIRNVEMSYYSGRLQVQYFSKDFLRQEKTICLFEEEGIIIQNHDIFAKAHVIRAIGFHEFQAVNKRRVPLKRHPVVFT
jgi:hypothetical protein